MRAPPYPAALSRCRSTRLLGSISSTPSRLPLSNGQENVLLTILVHRHCDLSNLDGLVDAPIGIVDPHLVPDVEVENPPATRSLSQLEPHALQCRPKPIQPGTAQCV